MMSGQPLVREMIQNAVEGNRLHHALLFHGPEGIGKYTAALELVRQLYCGAQDNRPCNTCRNCRRLQLPFVFHPDVQIYRETGTPVFLYREALIRQFGNDRGEPVPMDPDSDSGAVEQCISDLVSRGIIERHRVAVTGGPAVDVIHFSRETPFKTFQPESADVSPMQIWLIKKLQQYREAVCYNRSIRIDDVRNIQKMLYLHTFESNLKTVILDDADTMLVPAQNSLLKILEEPPGNTLIILIVTNPSGLLPTIRSRCQSIPFAKLSPETMHRILVDHYQCSPDIIKDRIPLSDGSLSRFLGTDWEVEFHRRGVFDELFLAGDDDPTGWALSTADAILSGAGGSPDDSLEAFYRWLHDSVCASPDNPVLPGRLPGHRPFSMKAALFLLDGLARIQTHRIFHTDTQLNLETMLLRLLQEME